MGHARDQWQQMQSGTLGPLKLHPDGHFSISGITFDQAASLESCTFGDAQVDKPSGEGQELKVSAPDRTHLLKYESGSWYHRSSKAAAKGRTGIAAKILLAVAVAFVLWRILS